MAHTPVGHDKLFSSLANCASLHARASAANASIVRSSGRAVGSMPAFSSSASPPSVFKLWRSILRRWPKAAAVTVSRSASSAGASGSAQRLQPHDRRGHRGRRHKGAAVDVEQDFGLGPPPRQHRKPAIMLAAGPGGDALGHFRWNIRVRLAQSGGHAVGVSHLIKRAVPTL